MKKWIPAGAFLAIMLTVAWPVTATTMTQKPFEQQDVDQFIQDYPTLVAWLAEQHGSEKPGQNPWVMAGMQFDRAFSEQLKAKGWKADRFFYLLNHLNQGIMLAQSDQDESLMQQYEKDLEKRDTQAKARAQDEQERLDEYMRPIREWAVQQLEEQKLQIQNNRFIHPAQKEHMLFFINNNQQLTLASITTLPSQTDAKAQEQNRRKAWFNTQKNAIQTNTFLTPYQRRWLIAQLDRQLALNMGYLNPQTPSPETVTHNTQEIQKQRLKSPEHLGKNTPSTTNQLQKQATANWKGAEKTPVKAKNDTEKNATIPKQEMALIVANRDKLAALFSFGK